jgi:hypothetical protein
MKTITATVPVFLTAPHVTLKSLSEETPERAVSTLCYYQPHGDSFPDRWTKCGMAEITVTFDDPEQITGSQIAILKAAKRKVQADCEVALNQIEGQIQSLLAIESK